MRADYPRVTHPCATLLETEVSFAFDLHVLSTPPAFNLSQNQTLQFKSVLKISCTWQKSESQRLFLPTRYSLVNEPPEGLRPLPPFSAARCRFMHHTLDRVNNFFSFRRSFFAVPRKAQRCCSVAGSGRYPSAPHLSTTFCKKVVRQPEIAPQSPARHGVKGSKF